MPVSIPLPDISTFVALRDTTWMVKSTSRKIFTHVTILREYASYYVLFGFGFGAEDIILESGVFHPDLPKLSQDSDFLGEDLHKWAEYAFSTEKQKESSSKTEMIALAEQAYKRNTVETDTPLPLKDMILHRCLTYWGTPFDYIGKDGLTDIDMLRLIYPGVISSEETTKIENVWQDVITAANKTFTSTTEAATKNIHQGDIVLLRGGILAIGISELCVFASVGGVFNFFPIKSRQVIFDRDVLPLDIVAVAPCAWFA